MVGKGSTYVVDYLYVEPWSLSDHSLHTAYVTALWESCILYSDGEKNDTAHWMYLYFTNTGDPCRKQKKLFLT